MEIDEKIFQLFITGTGECMYQALNRGLGGVIFFSRDIQSEEQFKSLVNRIIKESKIYPFLSIDQEGGRVERTENLHARYLSPKFAYQRGIEFLRSQTNDIADELCQYGINLNFSPCADVNTNPQNPIIGERSFSDNPEDVIKGVKIVSSIYRKNGIIPCIKHYPGHGDASKDSHLTLPQVDLSLNEMEQIHIKPFKSAIKDECDMVMAAHLHCTCFDNEAIPSSLSKNAIGYLREKLKYSGVVISDDMEMRGVKVFGPFEALVMAIKAGVDMFIFRDGNENVYDLIESLIELAKTDKELLNKIEESYIRIQALRKKYNIQKEA